MVQTPKLIERASSFELHWSWAVSSTLCWPNYPIKKCLPPHNPPVSSAALVWCTRGKWVLINYQKQVVVQFWLIVSKIMKIFSATFELVILKDLWQLYQVWHKSTAKTWRSESSLWLMSGLRSVGWNYRYPGPSIARSTGQKLGFCTYY